MHYVGRARAEQDGGHVPARARAVPARHRVPAQRALPRRRRARRGGDGAAHEGAALREEGALALARGSGRRTPPPRRPSRPSRPTARSSSSGSSTAASTTARAGCCRDSSRRPTARCARSRTRRACPASAATADRRDHRQHLRVRAQARRGAPRAAGSTSRSTRLRGLPEPRRRDGHFEYSYYLEQQRRRRRAARERARRRRGSSTPPARRAPTRSRGCTATSATLLLPSAARALDLDRAYGAIVRAQSFTDGRDAVLAPSRHVQERVTLGKKTGVERALLGPSEESAKPVLGHRLGLATTQFR